METPYALSPTGPTLDSLRDADALLKDLKDRAARKRAHRPTLEAASFRIVPKLHQDLKRISGKLEINQVDILHGLLEIALPVLDTLVKKPPAPPSPPALDFLSGIPPEKREQMQGLLQALAQVIKA